MILIIKGTIKGQSLKVSYPMLVGESIDYLSADFEFLTADWNGLEKWAHFRQGDVIIDIRLKDDKIIPTDSLNLSEGKWEFFLHGNTFENGKVKQRITTNTEYIFVERFGKLEGEPFPDSPPTAIEDIYAEIDELKKHGSGGGTGSGENGATFTPSVSDDGVISWTNDKGLPNPESKNIKGKNGKSAYEIAVDDGFEGSEEEWLASLKGDPYTLTEEDKQTIVDAVLDEVPTVETAEVGQTIVVKAVDENGKPTEWEAADFPSGGGEFRHISTIILEEDARLVYIDTDSEGNSFELTELAIHVYSVGAESNASDGIMKLMANTSVYNTGKRIWETGSGIRKNGSTQSQVIAISSNGIDGFSHYQVFDNAYVFDEDMKGKGYFYANGGAASHSVSLSTVSITSLLFAIEGSQLLFGKGSKFAIWGR